MTLPLKYSARNLWSVATPPCPPRRDRSGRVRPRRLPDARQRDPGAGWHGQRHLLARSHARGGDRDVRRRRAAHPRDRRPPGPRLRSPRDPAGVHRRVGGHFVDRDSPRPVVGLGDRARRVCRRQLGRLRHRGKVSIHPQPGHLGLQRARGRAARCPRGFVPGAAGVAHRSAPRAAHTSSEREGPGSVALRSSARPCDTRSPGLQSDGRRCPPRAHSPWCGRSRRSASG